MRLIRLLFGPLLLIFSMNSWAAESQFAQKIFRDVKPAVFQIKTATHPDAPKASYGTGFVIDKDGVLVTNYHVVSEAIQSDIAYKVYLMDEDTPHEAEILKVDVINDLALIRVKKKFPHALRLSGGMPYQGARIFSIGFPEDLNLTIVEGGYNEVIRYGPFEVVHMATPLNSGMSGGPTVSAGGEVIGVNVAYLQFSQNISFSVPLERLRKLTQKPYPENASPNEALHRQIGEQLANHEAILIGDFLANTKSSIQLPGWKAMKPAPYLKCWQDSWDHVDRLYSGVIHRCQLTQRAFLKQGVLSGAYRVEYQTLKSDRLNYWQTLNLAASEYNRGAEMSLFAPGYNYDKKVFTRYSCDESLVVNRNGIPIRLNYCVQAMMKYPGIYEATVKGMTLLKSKKFLLFFTEIWGFKRESILTFIQQIVDQIDVQESEKS